MSSTTQQPRKRRFKNEKTNSISISCNTNPNNRSHCPYAATNTEHSATPVVPSVQAQTNDSNVIGYIYEVENNGNYKKKPLTLGEFKSTRLEQTLGIYSKSISLGQVSQQQYDEISARLKTEFTNWDGKTSTISYVGMDGKTYTVPPFKQWNPGDPGVG